jgi:hypothetical protein
LDTHLPQAARERKDVSLRLLARIAERVTVLLGRADCSQITTGSSDDIGALPAGGACHRPTANDTATPAVPSPPSSPKVHTPEPQTPPPAVVPESKPTPPLTSKPQVPLVPVPVPTPTNRPVDPTLPSLPLPTLQVPSLLPGLPAIRIG